MTFKDHFSGHAGAYAAARPHYPDELFVWLATQAPSTRLAWDAGTGNGQAAVALAAHFEQVIATEPSAAQVDAAERHPRVEYRVEPAEAPSLEDASVDLVSVAQAMHWFDLERFHAGVKRALAPRGVIAVWTYGLSLVDDDVDREFMHLYDDVLGAYWPPERRHVENGYAELAFPYAPIEAPEFAMTCEWTLGQYLAYLRTWSATARYQREHGGDPVAAVTPRFEAAWGDVDATRTVRWPLRLRMGRVS